MKKILLLLILTIMLFPSNALAATVEEQQKAVVATGEAYYSQKVQIQYDSFRKNLNSTPEDATAKHTVYTVCSGFTFMTYYQALGIKIPDTTEGLLNYASKYKNTDSVIFYYGTKDEIYQKSVLGAGADSVTSTEKQNFINSIINKVQPGDIFVYSNDSGGHAVLVKKVDTKNKKIYIMESTGNKYDYEKHADQLESSGSILDNQDFTNQLKANRTRMALIRFINSNSSYKDYDGKTHSYDITEAAKTRVLYPKLTIEKTIKNVTNQAFAAPGDELTYQLVIKNTGSTTYKNINVVENVDYNLSITNNGGGNQNNNVITWNIASLSGGAQKTYTYTVKIPANYNLVGRVFTSTGKVNGIATSKIETRIGKRLSQAEKDKVKASFNKLKSKKTANTSREFINDVYKDALGIDLGISSSTNIGIMQFDGNLRVAGDSTLGVKYTKLSDKWKRYLYSNYYGLRIASEPNSTNHYVRASAAWNLYPTVEINDRARVITKDMLEDGDIVLAYVGRSSATDTELGNKGYLYLNNILYMYNTSSKSFSQLSSDSLKNFLNGLVGENYIILRPHTKVMLGISVSKAPQNTVYTQNKGQLNLFGGELTIHYDDGSTDKLDLGNSNITVSGFDNSTCGTKPINVSYQGHNTTFNIEVVEKRPQKITVSKLPVKTKYIQNQEQLDLTGGELTISYDNDSTEKISLKNSQITISKFDNKKLGKNTVTVEYLGLKTFFNVEIIKATDQKIVLVSKPLKTSYYKDTENLDLTGGVIGIIQSDGKTQTISMSNKNVKVSGFNNKELGLKTITVEYQKQKLQFSVEIIDHKITDIKITTPPTKTNYIASLEELDLTGGVITITYEDGTTDTMSLTSSDVVVSGFNNGVVGSNNLTVQYRDLTTSFPVNIIDKKISGVSVSTKPTKLSYILKKETLDLTGGELTIHYDDGSTDTMSLTNKNIKVTGFDNTKEGVNNIGVEYATHKTIFSVEIVTDFNMKDLQSNKIMLYAIAIVGCLIAVVIISISVVIYKKRTKKKVPKSYVPQTEDILPLPDQDQSQIPDQRQN